MSGFAAWMVPLMLLVPQPLADGQQSGESAPLTPQAQVEDSATVERGSSWLSLEAFERAPTVNQVRIKQRVIIRVAPRRTSRRSLTATLPMRPNPRQTVEKKIGKCLPLKRIAAVQPDRGNRLLLFLRDNRIIAANLERACAARDFYSGFYLERSKDGKLCVNRDRLQSRTGVKCKLGRIRELVPFDT